MEVLTTNMLTVKNHTIKKPSKHCSNEQGSVNSNSNCNSNGCSSSRSLNLR